MGGFQLENCPKFVQGGGATGGTWILREGGGGA